MLIKQKSPSLSRNLALRTFGELLIVFSTKVNLLYLLYSTTWRCCLLHLIKQNCLVKTFLRTLILMKESCFPNCWKVSLVFPVFKNVGERSTAKNYCPVSLLSVVSKVFEKLVSNKSVEHLQKCGLLSDFQYGFRSFQSTINLLTVLSDRIARAFNRSGAARYIQGF